MRNITSQEVNSVSGGADSFGQQLATAVGAMAGFSVGGPIGGMIGAAFGSAIGTSTGSAGSGLISDIIAA